MKSFIIALTLISCGTAAGASEKPTQFRVSLQFFEMSQPALTEMLAAHQKSGLNFHDETLALTKSGNAKLLETCMVVCRNTEKVSLETIREEIYPTEYAPPRLPCDLSTGHRMPHEPPANPLCRTPTAFDTRNTGVTWEVWATAAADGMISLALNPEIVSRLRLETHMEHTDQWGDGSIRMPIFEAWKIQSSISVKPGKFELVSALTPKANPQIPGVTRKILVFVRVDDLLVP